MVDHMVSLLVLLRAYDFVFEDASRWVESIMRVMLTSYASCLIQENASSVLICNVAMDYRYCRPERLYMYQIICCRHAAHCLLGMSLAFLSMLDHVLTSLHGECIAPSVPPFFPCRPDWERSRLFSNLK